MIDLDQVDLDQLADLAEQELARRTIVANKDILAWGKFYFPEKFKLPYCDLHRYLVDHRDTDFTNTIAPRAHAKTTVSCFLIPIYTALNEPDLYHHYINVQGTATKAITTNITIKNELEHNEKLHRDYGDQKNDEKWTERQFVLKNGVIFSAIGAGESLRGINYGNIRPDYMIIDDLYDDDERNNKDMILKKENWMWGALYPARSKTNRSVVHIQGTVANPLDLLHKLQKVKGVQSWLFTAIMDHKTKKVLWPELNTYDDLIIEKNRMGSINFEREYQGQCHDDESSIIKESWIRYARAIPDGHKIERVICGVDPSIGASDQADFTGIAIIYRTMFEGSKYWYIAYAKGLRLSMNERIKILRELGELYPINEMKVESIAGFKDFTAELRRTTNLPVVEIARTKDKITNRERHSAKFENGKVMILASVKDDDRLELVDQLINNTPNFDDVCDAVFLALDDTTSRLRVGVI